MYTDFRIKIANYLKNYPYVTINFPSIIINDRVTLILGENGSGKSTLLRSIVGLLRYQGSITINGSFSYMPEHTYFPKDTTVRAFLDALLLLEKGENHYLELLNLFGLTHKIDTLITSLSKGMQGKLNLIQCLMIDADIYLLDEPFNGLDKESVIILINYINTSKKAFILSSHIIEVYKNLQKTVISL